MSSSIQGNCQLGSEIPPESWAGKIGIGMLGVLFQNTVKCRIVLSLARVASATTGSEIILLRRIRGPALLDFFAHNTASERETNTLDGVHTLLTQVSPLVSPKTVKAVCHVLSRNLGCDLML